MQLSAQLNHNRGVTAHHLSRHRPRQRRSFARSSRVAIWAFAFALLVKSAVPLLASASAAWQGKAIADVCDVYGVRTIALDADGQPKVAMAFGPAPASVQTSMDMGMGMLMPAAVDPSAAAGGHADHADVAYAHADHEDRSARSGALAHDEHRAHHGDHGPDHGAHGGDHCALTAVVALAATAAPAAAVSMAADRTFGDRIHPETPTLIDAMARWAARIEHGPPPSA